MKKKVGLIGVGILGMSLLLGACGEVEPKKRTEDLSVDLNTTDTTEEEAVEKTSIFKDIQPEAILESNGVQVLYIGAKKDVLWGYGLEFEIANNSGEQRIVQTESISVNNLMADGIFFSSDLPAGKASSLSMDFYDTELKPGDVVEGFIYVLNADYSNISESIPFKITVQ